MPAPDAHVEDLLETANASSGIARTAWITFLGFAAYFLVIIGATTHRQLLLGSPVELPILGVDLPLFDFYRYAPALFLLLHLNLLLQLDGLAAKLFRFDSALKRSSMQMADKEKVRARLHPFLFTRMLVGAPMGSVQRALIGLSVWSTVVIGPVILLLACQIRFLPYHAVDMTWWHRIVILLDLAMLWLLWPAILHPSNTAAGAWRAAAGQSCGPLALRPSDRAAAARRPQAGHPARSDHSKARPRGLWPVPAAHERAFSRPMRLFCCSPARCCRCSSAWSSRRSRTRASNAGSSTGLGRAGSLAIPLISRPARDLLA
ncbi:MAG: hypothetical protein ACFB22_15045 [Rhodothalassiaceae bacterium]